MGFKLTLIFFNKAVKIESQSCQNLVKIWTLLLENIKPRPKKFKFNRKI